MGLTMNKKTDDSEIRYWHQQRGTLVVAILLPLALAILGLGIWKFKPICLAAPILLLAAWLFHSLTIEISGGELRWQFGPGWIRKSIPLAEIASARVVRTNFHEGWGIHWSRFGWLYNVSGFDAVAVTLHDGKKFALGTDEPARLVEAIQKNLA
jgi:hypothetical protein